MPSRSKQCFPCSALSTIPGKTFLLRPCSTRRGWICLRPSWHVCGRCTRGAIFFAAVCHGAETLDDDLGRKLREFCARLESWRTAARISPLGDLLQRLYSETGYPEYVQGPARRGAAIGEFARPARAGGAFDGFTQGGLTRFLRFVESLQAEEGDLGEAPVLGEGDDVVRIMSIHKSKGLQFPVVIVADLGKRFNISDRVGTVLYDGHLGIAPQWADPELGLRAPTVAHQAVAEARRRAAVAEELRVLYVALTRAQEKLVLVGSTADIWATAAGWSQAAEVDGWALPDALLARANTFLDWIGPAVMRHRDGEPLRKAAEKESGVPVHVRDPNPSRIRLGGRYGFGPSSRRAAWRARPGGRGDPGRRLAPARRRRALGPHH